MAAHNPTSTFPGDVLLKDSALLATTWISMLQ